ncbi:hypothetical protein D9613_009636 [Agrocybe pediades]|uniref:F-box domain-containing protein n=1 Tax=Agrocybe pediades TaxID=84607 RepID=A0A8H4VWI6_9AGAR|nr:hypothetical protein D9613_009636 [Agrocybe pediades]
MDGALSMSFSSKQLYNPDVLSEIFLSLTSYDQYDPNSQPLKALRLASHVCSSWRQLILSSPVIWARNINVDELNHMTDDWRSEVLRRTGDAVLSIKGTGRHLSAKSERFIVSLLRDSWHRIKYIQICLSPLSRHRSRAFSQILRTPAPNLEHFAVGNIEVVYSNEQDNDEVERAEELVLGDDGWKYYSVSFGGKAPRLKHFSCPALLLPAVSQPWFSQVLHLECGEINGRNLLNALPYMPNLETLHVHITTDLPEIPVFSPADGIILPRLHDVRITTYSPWRVGLAILVALQPRPEFKLDFDVQDGVGDVSIEDADAIKHVLSQLFTGTSPDLKEDCHLQAVFYDTVFEITIPQKFRLSFSTWDSLSALLGILRMPLAPFYHATELNIDIKYSVVNPHSDTMAQFFSSLTLVHSLKTDMETLVYIHKLSLRYDDTHLLPSLRHLELLNYDKFLANMIEEFLDYRHDPYGTPILSLTCHGLWGDNLSNLERFNGILFRGCFGDEEVHYVCGSGNPERLDFTATAIADGNSEIEEMEILKALAALSTFFSSAL